eukprot:215199_1
MTIHLKKTLNYEINSIFLHFLVSSQRSSAMGCKKTRYGATRSGNGNDVGTAMMFLPCITTIYHIIELVVLVSFPINERFAAIVVFGQFWISLAWIFLVMNLNIQIQLSRTCCCVGTSENQNTQRKYVQIQY